MCWSINFIGKPENIVTAIQEQSKRLEGSDASKAEYDEAMPNIIALVKQNFSPKEGYPILEISASGSAYDIAGTKKYSYCNVSIKTLAAQLV